MVSCFNIKFVAKNCSKIELVTKSTNYIGVTTLNKNEFIKAMNSQFNLKHNELITTEST